jgi:ClpP class serine protease
VLERLGIERRLYTAGSKKSMLDPFRPQDPEDVDRLMEIMGEIHTDFKGMVRERRGRRLSAGDADLFEGQIWTGRKALELGLIDGLGDVHGTLKERFGEKEQWKIWLELTVSSQTSVVDPNSKGKQTYSFFHMQFSALEFRAFKVIYRGIRKNI